MSRIIVEREPKDLQADCSNCFALCCVALPYAKSADFAFDKASGTPCRNLNSEFRCNIHSCLRSKGFKGCTVYECFGAGQKVSQQIYHGSDWRENPQSGKEMFDVFPIMQQLHEMLYYINEALNLEKARVFYNSLQELWDETVQLTELSPNEILLLDIPAHRAKISHILSQISEQIRGTMKNKQSRIDLIGANLKNANLKGSNFRGALLIAADLRNANLQMSDFIGADLRDTDLRGADLTKSIFLTQSQVNAAKGDHHTKLPAHLKIPGHWFD